VGKNECRGFWRPAQEEHIRAKLATSGKEFLMFTVSFAKVKKPILALSKEVLECEPVKDGTR
jgi:hypothetical protein